VSAAASNYTPVSQRVQPNDLQFVFSGPLDNLSNLQNKLEWFPSVNYGTITAQAFISTPNGGDTIVTFTPPGDDSTKLYWQIAPPGPALIGAFVSGPGVPPGTVVKAQGDVKDLVLILSNHVPDSKRPVSLTFSGTAPANPITDSGFETPVQTATPPANFSFNPSSPDWTFDQNSGIAGNGSTLTALNGPAPEGTQVAFLQNQGAVSQTVKDLQAGTYTLSFEAAQRQNGQTIDQQTIAILVDGKPVTGGNITPSGANYTAYSVPFAVTAAGQHVITIEGTGGANAMAFIDAVSLTVKLPSALASSPAGPPPTPALGAGSPAPVAQDRNALFVEALYRDVLQRPAHPGELKHWEHFLRAGGSLKAVAAALVTSPAYLHRHPNAASFLTGLYRDVLDRRPDPRGLAGWLRFARAHPDDWLALAQAFQSAPESLKRLRELFDQAEPS
jgi:hypothetical protein